MSEYDIFTSPDETAITKIYSRRTLTKFEPPVREFVEPNASDAFIFWLFRYRCVMCKKSGNEINEIVPRSRSKKSIGDWKNRVLLCNECHEIFHKDGVTDEKIEEMRQRRFQFLKSFDRSEYAT